MAEMNERLSLAEGRLAKTEAELAATKNALAKSITAQAEALTCLATKDDLAITKDDLAITKEALMFKTDELEREVAILRSPPYIHVCGSHYDYLSLSDSSGTHISLEWARNGSPFLHEWNAH